MVGWGGVREQEEEEEEGGGGGGGWGGDGVCGRIWWVDCLPDFVGKYCQNPLFSLSPVFMTNLMHT
jgi:hypothetical protein